MFVFPKWCEGGSANLGHVPKFCTFFCCCYYPLEPIVTKALTEVSTSKTPDKFFENLHTEIVGRLQGLIGIKHSDSFPEASFQLQNGLIIFKHKLRPA